MAARSYGGGKICCFDGVCTMPDAPWHGNYGGYCNHRCRCRPCKDAWAAYQADSGARKRYRDSLKAMGRTARGTEYIRPRKTTE